MPVQPDHILASSTPVSDFMINAFCARDRLTPHDPIARESLAGSHQAALDYWLNLSVQDAIPSFSDFKLIELGRYAERVILTDVSHDPEIDFRFRFFGTHVDERVSEQYTDKRLAEFERCGPDSNIWKVYETVVRSRAPLISQFEYVGLIPDITGTSELYLPLVANDGSISRIVVAVEFIDDVTVTMQQTRWYK